jgi:hypothetical protein
VTGEAQDDTVKTSANVYTSVNNGHPSCSTNTKITILRLRKLVVRNKYIDTKIPS